MVKKRDAIIAILYFGACCIGAGVVVGHLSCMRQHTTPKEQDEMLQDRCGKMNELSYVKHVINDCVTTFKGLCIAH